MQNQTLVKNRPLAKQFARFVLPSVIGMVMSSLYTVIDGIFVGRGVGEAALGAVNLIYPFIMAQIALSMLVAVGGANIYSMRRGKNQPDDANRAFSKSMVLLAFFSVLVNGAALLFSGPFARLLGADETLLPMAQSYLFWMALFGIVYMPGLGLSIFVRNDNNPRLEMFSTLAGALGNIVLDYLFIMVFGWGVAGAAIASGIGQMVSVVFYTTHLASKKNTLRWQRAASMMQDVKKILFNGVSSFLTEFSQSAITLSFNLVLMAQIGATGVAAYSIVMYVCSIFNMMLIGIGQGVQPLLSFSHGANKCGDEKRIYRMGLFSNFAVSAVCFGVIFLFGKQLAVLFSPGNPALTATAYDMMLLYFLGFFPIGVSLMNITYFQTTEQEPKSIALSLMRCIGFVQIFLLLLPQYFGINGICLSLLCGELCNCVVGVIFMRRSKLQQRVDAGLAVPKIDKTA